MKNYPVEKENPMIHPENMTTDEWIAFREEKIDAFYVAGGELKPNPDCNNCDAPNNYVCFACECHQLEMP